MEKVSCTFPAGFSSCSSCRGRLEHRFLLQTLASADRNSTTSFLDMLLMGADSRFGHQTVWIALKRGTRQCGRVRVGCGCAYLSPLKFIWNSQQEPQPQPQPQRPCLGKNGRNFHRTQCLERSDKPWIGSIQSMVFNCTWCNIWVRLHR